MRHEIPTHLNVEDGVLLGLTARQLATLMAAAGIGYRLWLQLEAQPMLVRASLTGACLVLGLVLALVRPGGRPLDQWGWVVLAYLAAPRRTCWAVAEPDVADWRPGLATGWIELTPSVVWSGSVNAEEALGR